ncbi:MAG: hypothetical protein AAFX87_24290 [Bacteroidota bacterium]
MISIKNILTIAKYESKVLWRNWFFRIVSLIGVFFVTVFNLGVFSEVDTPRWFVQSNAWIQPYSAMILISIAQAATVIFLASGLIKKDKKIDTNEVFFVRPISNLDYVLGKAFALFKLFFWLNLVLLLIPLIINLTSPVLTFNPLAFVFYPLMTSLPTIVFATGLAFLTVTLLRNQPITIVLLIGLAGVELIYYFDKFSNILDFMAFRLSMYTSEMAGFVDLEFALWQRSFYIVAGIACLFMTAFFLDRLAGHKVVRMANGLIAVCLLGVAAFMMLNLWEMRQSPFEKREQMIAVNDEWIDQPNIDILAHDISLKHSGYEIASTSKLEVKNNTNASLSTIFFTLNPSLEVDEVKWNGTPVEFDRNMQILSIEKGLSITPGQTGEIELSYHGTISESVAHLEVGQERYEAAYDFFMFSLQKKYAFLQPDYVLLTKDVLWYPDTQVGYSRKSPAKERTSFTDFQLEVSTTSGLVPVSQGSAEVENGVYQFRPEYPLPQLSLAIGNYVKKEVVVDSVSYAIYHYPKNDYFVKHLGQLSDTLSYLVTDIVNEYEDGQKLKYPFNRLQFVETPIQFSAFNKIYEGQQAFVQPETVYWPEEGGAIREFDLRRQMRSMNRQAREENQVLSEKEKQANIFNDLIKKVFTKQSADVWVFDGRDEDEPDYALFPNLYTYNSGIVSREWALLNRSIAHYLNNEKQAQNDFSRNFNGISFTEECNLLMQESSITQILTEETDFNKIKKSVSLKAEYLFSYLGQLLGEEALKDFLYNWMSAHQHQLTTYEDFQKAFQERFEMPLDPIIQKVYFDTEQAAYEISNVRKYEVLDGDRKRYQVLLDIENTGKNDGVVEIKFNTGDDSDRNRFRRRVNQEVEEDEPGYLAVIKQGEIKQFGFILDEKPKEITINTLISSNIPSVITTSIGTFSKGNLATLFEGEKPIEARPLPAQLEVIVDNEDSAFSTFSPIKATYMRAYLDSRKESDKKYHGNWFRSYSKWLATTGSGFYGKTIRSAHFTRSGKGEKEASWSPNLEEEGFYDVYAYMIGKNQNAYLGRNNSRQYKYNYVIHHADGQDEIAFNVSGAEPGWNYLGSYYFNQGGGQVVLTDECDLRTVYADAIKWVKQ